MPKHLLDNMVCSDAYNEVAEPALAYIEGMIDLPQLIDQLREAPVPSREKILLIFSLGQWRRFKEKADADTRSEIVHRAMLDLRSETYGLHHAAIDLHTGMAEVCRVGYTPSGAFAMALDNVMPAPSDGSLPIHEWWEL